MNRKLTAVLICALLIASGTSYVAYRAATGRARSGPLTLTAKVVVAAHDLKAGMLVRAADLTMVGWTGAPLKGMIPTKEAAIGRGVASAIYEGEPVIESRLAVKGSGGGLAGTIPSGMRACAVRVNEVVGVAGFVTPGMRVDVLFTGVPPGGATEGGAAVKTILQNIQVLSAGVNIDKDKEGKPLPAQVVNLLVSPIQAEILSLAGNETRIQLILRNPMDTQTTETPGTIMANLFGEFRYHNPGKPASRPPAVPIRLPATPPQAGAAVVKNLYLIEVLNGPTRTETKFRSAEDHQ